MRALAWFKSQPDLGISDCSKCKEMNTPIQRQYLGCGYLPTLKGPRTMWQPPTGKHGYQGAPLDVCAGYTTSLPEVREVALMYRHWSKGNLAVALCGDKATDDLCSLIVILDGEINALEMWRMTDGKDA